MLLILKIQALYPLPVFWSLYRLSNRCRSNYSVTRCEENQQSSSETSVLETPTQKLTSLDALNRGGNFHKASVFPGFVSRRMMIPLFSVLVILKHVPNILSSSNRTRKTPKLKSYLMI